MVAKKYIIVTACKNEGKNLPDLIESLTSQTITPKLWVIVDDGSSDDGPLILQKAMEQYNWIHILRMKEGKRDLGLHYSNIIITGFNHVIKVCEEKGIQYDYFGILDADLIFENTFYANLINEFEKDSNLGVASGGTEHIIGDKKVKYRMSQTEPSGGHMVIRSICLKEISGIPLSYSIDSVIKAKARIRGWKTRRFEDYVAREIRDVGNAEGYWRGFSHIGEASYYLNLNPVHASIKMIKFSFKKPYYGGIAYFLGYSGGLLGRKKQIDDEEIRHYFWNKWKEYL